MAQRSLANPRRSRGFTLIELLVALAVMALLAIVSWRGLDGMVRAQEQTRQRGNELLVLQAALAQWGTDLDALLPLAHTVPLDWDGQVLRITRRSSAVPDPGALVVAWTRRNVQGQSQWLRWQSLPLRTRAEWQQAWQQAAIWSRNPSDADQRAEMVLMPLTDWQIFYYRGGAWSNPQSSSDANPEADAPVSISLPDGVRLQLQLPPGQALAGRLTRDWVNPLQGGGKS
ncbi:PulJ/GspJ family protein [Simplicispira psychrophila]|uniref:PulJ/GspJ family protein n=1 Tax=Simplicispira psychrophila TaxID=80882 RepID=UPI0005629FDA|nr:prepilin-type N-terminal cleavage/methylation domain-containing protein [Simplicispira psychrophila]